MTLNITYSYYNSLHIQTLFVIRAVATLNVQCSSKKAPGRSPQGNKTDNKQDLSKQPNFDKSYVVSPWFPLFDAILA